MATTAKTVVPSAPGARPTPQRRTPSVFHGATQARMRRVTSSSVEAAAGDGPGAGPHVRIARGAQVEGELVGGEEGAALGLTVRGARGDLRQGAVRLAAGGEQRRGGRVHGARSAGDEVVAFHATTATGGAPSAWPAPPIPPANAAATASAPHALRALPAVHHFALPLRVYCLRPANARR